MLKKLAQVTAEVGCRERCAITLAARVARNDEENRRCHEALANLTRNTSKAIALPAHVVASATTLEEEISRTRESQSTEQNESAGLRVPSGRYGGGNAN